MGEQGWLRLLVTGLATAHVAGLVAGHVLPWTGSLAMTAFLLYTLSLPGPLPVVVARRIGVACLAAVALSVDARTGGSGFPNALLDLTGPGARELDGTLIVAGLVALAVAAGLGRRRGVHLAGLAAVAFLALLVAPMLYAWSRPQPEEQLRTRITTEAREQLLARARAANPGRDVVIAIAVQQDSRPLPAAQAPDWSLGLLPAAPAAALFAALAFIATGRGTADPA
ncbi:hypothetical protein [Dactylosporangium sp. NPDC049140]|uniref:hypothetical protein n=1 Tax=Dactylosporangium sp. NPDC049140 TaxID=3155647 RepID=UPI0034080B27